MVNDILRFYELNTKGFTSGLFTVPLEERTWDDRPKKSIHGVSYTQFGDAFSMQVSEHLSLFDLFHGYCHDFAMYFVQRNPEWDAFALKRDTAYQSLVHAYAVRKQDYGTNLFADARGITDNVVDFFSDFRFSKDAFITPLKKQVLTASTDKEVEIEEACKAGYGLIFSALGKEQKLWEG